MRGRNGGGGGVGVFAARLLAFAIGAFFAGQPALWAHLITAFTPGSFSFAVTFNIIVMLVVGGMGSINLPSSAPFSTHCCSKP